MLAVWCLACRKHPTNSSHCRHNGPCPSRNPPALFAPSSEQTVFCYALIPVVFLSAWPYLACESHLFVRIICHHNCCFSFEQVEALSAGQQALLESSVCLRTASIKSIKSLGWSLMNYLCTLRLRCVSRFSFSSPDRELPALNQSRRVFRKESCRYVST